MDEIAFRTTPYFERLAKKMLPQGAFDAAMAELRVNPRKGDVIQDTGGARKIRVSLPGRGKSGGARDLRVRGDIRCHLLFAHLYQESAS